MGDGIHLRQNAKALEFQGLFVFRAAFRPVFRSSLSEPVTIRGQLRERVVEFRNFFAVVLAVDPLRVDLEEHPQAVA
jgi:hypothetical protein